MTKTHPSPLQLSPLCLYQIQQLKESERLFLAEFYISKERLDPIQVEINPTLLQFLDQSANSFLANVTAMLTEIKNSQPLGEESQNETAQSYLSLSLFVENGTYDLRFDSRYAQLGEINPELDVELRDQLAQSSRKCNEMIENFAIELDEKNGAYYELQFVWHSLLGFDYISFVRQPRGGENLAIQKNRLLTFFEQGLLDRLIQELNQQMEAGLIGELSEGDFVSLHILTNGVNLLDSVAYVQSV